MTGEPGLQVYNVTSNAEASWKQREKRQESWIVQDFHRKWVADEIERQFRFFDRNLININGGFEDLDTQGRPIPTGYRSLQSTCRTIYCYSIAQLLGRPGSRKFIDHGVDFLFDRLADKQHGGFFHGINHNEEHHGIKDAYGHAFALLAGAAAVSVGHEKGEYLLFESTDVIFNHFWDPIAGASKDSFSEDWKECENYRGQNANMHLMEAFLAAYDVTQDRRYLEAATSIAELLINIHARRNNWRVIEHFDENWNPLHDYESDVIFKPRGTAPGHSLEWSRLLLRFDEITASRLEWAKEAAINMFRIAMTNGWDHEKGGFFYTLDKGGEPILKDRLWWPCAEGLGSASMLIRACDPESFEADYRRIWDFVEQHFLDRVDGGWKTQLDDQLRPVQNFFAGKPDLYHVLQACVVILLPRGASPLVNPSLRLNAS
ncbi:MAG: AGE family epimerase/isomerase [Segniliparus sp.]|uniref:AGE family epimerase/isomerase n=1 Tax=Segniliparus sp. TaxID=2804064 RepID=UPI003F39EFD5